MSGIIDSALKGLETLSSALDTATEKARTTMGVIGEASRSVEGLQSSLTALEGASQSASESVRRNSEAMHQEATPRINDVLDTLETTAAAGERWAVSLMNVIHNALEGTIRTEEAFQKFGDITVLFEGQLVRVDTLLREFLPTTGEVQKRILELAEDLKDASIDELLEQLSKSYSQWGKYLGEIIEKFKAGKVSLEHVLRVAREIQKLVPDSEAGMLARLLEEGLLDGSLT